MEANGPFAEEEAPTEAVGDTGTVAMHVYAREDSEVEPAPMLSAEDARLYDELDEARGYLSADDEGAALQSGAYWSSPGRIFMGGEDESVGAHGELPHAPQHPPACSTPPACGLSGQLTLPLVPQHRVASGSGWFGSTQDSGPAIQACCAAREYSAETLSRNCCWSWVRTARMTEGKTVESAVPEKR